MNMESFVDHTPGLELGFALAAMDGLSLPGFAMALHLFTLEFRPTEHFGFSANLLSLDFAALSKNGITASTALAVRRFPRCRTHRPADDFYCVLLFSQPHLATSTS